MDNFFTIQDLIKTIAGGTVAIVALFLFLRWVWGDEKPKIEEHEQYYDNKKR